MWKKRIKLDEEVICCAATSVTKVWFESSLTGAIHPGDLQTLISSWYWQESFLDEGFILDKRIGVGQPKRMENAKILVANTAMDTDKIKIYGARVRVDSMQKVT